MCLSEAALIDRLLATGSVKPSEIERARKLATESKTALPAALTRLGLLSEADLAQHLSQCLSLELVSRSALPAVPPLAEGLNFHYLRARQVLPIDVEGAGVTLAMANPLDTLAIQGIRFAYNRPVRPVVATESDISDALAGLSGEAGPPDDGALEGLAVSLEQEQEDLGRLQDMNSDAPVIRLVNRLVGMAVARRASDIHIEPQPRALVIRFRVDGSLQEVERLSDRWAGPIASRIKVMAKLDIAEKRLPQDGRIRLSVQGRDLDIRVATAPTLHGESLVLRLLGRSEIRYDLDHLEISEQALRHIKAALDKPHGMILLTGPTGSGKTTTLYAALNRLLRPEIKILTVEDPVEYVIGGVNQVQVKPEIGLTYASALRAFLRHDPNILMIGEIRDGETADIAMHFALVGRLVLSTLHTNSAVGAVTRLLEMGIEPYVLASILRLTVAQRLIRKLCPACRTPRPSEPHERALLRQCLPADHIPDQLMTAVGCPACEGSGYHGRALVIEAVPITAELQNLIRARADDASLARAAAAAGIESLRTHALSLAAQGITSLDEVLRTIDADASGA